MAVGTGQMQSSPRKVSGLVRNNGLFSKHTIIHVIVNIKEHVIHKSSKQKFTFSGEGTIFISLITHHINESADYLIEIA